MTICCDWCGNPFRFSRVRHLRVVAGVSTFYICSRCVPAYEKSMRERAFEPGFVRQETQKQQQQGERR